MPAELKATVINMKELSQDIKDPIIINQADADGRTLEIFFTQEAAAQLTPHTKVYLSWRHIQRDIRGYNVFTEAPKIHDDDPPRWFIHYPQSMLYEGDVRTCIELVDDVSIAASTNFIIHVLQDPNDGSTFVVSDDFSVFKQAVIAMNSLADQVRDQMAQIETEWGEMQIEHEYIVRIVQETEALNQEMQETLAQMQQELNDALDNLQQQFENYIDQTDAHLEEWLAAAEATLAEWAGTMTDYENRIEALENADIEIIHRIEELEQNAQDWSIEIDIAKQEAIDYTDAALTWNVLPHTYGAYIMGQGNEDNCYVTVINNRRTRSLRASNNKHWDMYEEFTFSTGDTLYIYCKGSVGGGSIFINNENVAADENDAVEYSFTLPAHDALIEMDYSDIGLIRIHTDDPV